MPSDKYFKTHEEYLQWYRDYRKRNPKIREYTRIYNNKWRQKNGYGAEERSKKKFPEKALAVSLLNQAVSKGLIKRGVCEVCGKEKAQGHHDDYFKPLEVRWLCPFHHKQHHISLSTGKLDLHNKVE